MTLRRTLLLLVCAALCMHCGNDSNPAGSGSAATGDAGGTAGDGGKATAGDTGTAGNTGTAGGTDTAGDTGTAGNTGTAGGTDTAGDTGTAGGTDTAGDTGTTGDTGTAGGTVPDPATDFDWTEMEAGLHESARRYLTEANEGALGIPVTADARPAFGTWYTTPFQTAITALTPQANSNHAYSQLQAFSADNAYVLLAEDVEGSLSATNVVRKMSDFEVVLSVPVGTWGNPRWDPTDPSSLVHFNDDDSGELRLERTNVSTGITATEFTFPAEYQTYLTNQSFDELSRDGRWIAGQAVGAGNWSRIFSLDRVTQTLGAQLDPEALYAGPCTPDPEWGPVDPDWVGVSPLGKYLMVQWAAGGTGRCQGLETYDIQTGAYVGHVTGGHPHADLTVLADGVTEVFVSAELFGPNPDQLWVGGASSQAIDSENPSLSYRELPGPAVGESEPKFLYLIDWGGFEHISCRGPIGTCLVTGYPSPENGTLDPLENEIYLIRLDGSGVIRLAHHHSSGAEYWSQPRASISLDGRYVIFDTDWGLNNETLAFLIDLAIVPTQ